jgi:predicted RNA-binding protein with PIN domain
LGLLHFLVESLEPAELAQTIVVFDAREPPPGLPREIQFHGLSVRFAVKYESADALIEELIQADFTPKQLTVVSSDHRIQRAARRRKARAVDSEVWYAEVMRRQSQQGRPRQPAARPATPMLAGEVACWLEQFGGEAIVDQVIQEERSKGSVPVRPATPDPSARPAAPPSQQTPSDGKKAAHPGSAKKHRNLANPFPLGYGEDLSKKDQARDLRNPFPPGYAEDLEGES